MPSKVWGEITYHPTLQNGYNYLSTLGLKLIHISERGPWWCTTLVAFFTMSFRFTPLALLVQPYVHPSNNEAVLGNMDNYIMRIHEKCLGRISFPWLETTILTLMYDINHVADSLVSANNPQIYNHRINRWGL